MGFGVPFIKKKYNYYYFFFFALLSNETENLNPFFYVENVIGYDNTNYTYYFRPAWWESKNLRLIDGKSF